MDISTEFKTARQADVQKYRNTTLKVRKTHAHIQFNKTCLQHNVTPQYTKIKIKHKTRAADITKHKAEIIYTKESIKQLHRKKDMLNHTLLKIHLKLANTIGTTEMLELIENTHKWVDKKLAHTRRSHEQKLAKLVMQNNITSPTTTHQFHPRTVNLTTTTFTNDEMSVIEKGLKHNLHYNQENSTVTQIILDTETAIQKTNQNDQDKLRFETVNTITKQTQNKHPHKNKENIITKNIKQKIENNKITLTKADKGNTVVIINTDTLNEKVLSYIEKNNITELPKDPTDNYHTTIKQAVNHSKHIIPEPMKRYLKQIHPKAPTIQALPKIHKPDTPIRPVINYQQAPAYKLAKHMDTILRQHININTETHIRNSTDLIHTIKDIHIPHNSTLASFDIENLYTNVPIQETINIIENKLRENETPEDEITEITNTLHIITQQNYFTFNNKFYTQPDGLPMGSPISSIMAEIFLQHIEHTHIIQHNKHSEKIIYWKRFVDDILLLYRGNTRQCQQLLTNINKIHHKLTFTAEYEKDKAINFLDLTILKNNSQKHSFKIYRKPTMTDTLIHNTSNHPTQHKHAAFRSMIHRLLNTPMSPEDYKEEINTIKYMAHTNGYEHTLIDKLMKQMKKNNKNPQHTQTNNKYITLTYINKHTEKLAHKFRKSGYKVAFRTKNKTIKHLTTRTQHTDRHTAPGVYKLNCSECNKFYIGQTGRSFTQRFKEHTKVTVTSTESAYTNHLIDSGHTHPNINNHLDILHIQNKGAHLNTLEQYEIYKYTRTQQDNILNEQTHFKSHTLFEHILENYLPNFQTGAITNPGAPGGKTGSH